MEIVDINTLILCVISSTLICLFAIYSWHIFLTKKFNFKDYKIYLGLIIGVICCLCINLLLPNSMKIIMTTIIYCILCYVFFCKNIYKAVIMSVLSQIITFICEGVLAIVVVVCVGNDMDILLGNKICLWIINIGVPILAFLTLKTPYPLKLYNYLVKTFNNIKQTNLILYFLTTAISMTMFLVLAYMELPFTIILTCNMVLAILYIIIIVRLANVRGAYTNITSKFQTSLSSLKESEAIIDQHRIDNHENKNQLLIIRNMVKANDKTTVKYIDTLIDNKINDNENIFYKTSKIPSGGLRFTIYSKLCKMKDMDIEYSLEIANDVSASDLINMDDNTILNICKIIGVFLDNAIEAVENLDEKDIIVEIFIIDNNLCIEISNNYKEAINLEKISNRGYSTKGKGHGYGLTLVSELVKSDSNLKNEKEINKDLFTQRLKIKM